MNYQEALDYLYSQLPMFHRIGAPAYKANLDNTIALAKVTGFPYTHFNSIHIAGTNGKGSVSHMLASSFQEAGLKTGLFTSPHLIDFRERIKINGEMISKQFVIEFILKHQSDFQNIRPSFFEMTFIMAMCYFKDRNVDIAIVETGLGGRLDSTNVISPILSVITNIGYDHMQFLGETLESIAREKAGIIKERTPVIVGESHPETDKIFIERASHLKSELLFADKALTTIIINKERDSINNQYCSLKIESLSNENDQFESLINKPISVNCPLKGIYQARNINTVFACLPFIKEYLNETKLTTGIQKTVQNTNLMGRWQILQKHPLVICDIAHNTHGLKYVIEQLERQKFEKLHVVLGMVNDKDINSMLALMPHDAVYYFCKADIPRGLDSTELKKIANTAGLNGEDYGSVVKAFNAAKQYAGDKDLIFVGGSAFTVAEVLPLYHQTDENIK